MKTPKWTLIAMISFTFLLPCMSGRAKAQSLAAADSSSGPKDFIGKIRQTYGNAAYLQFRVTYRYANERQPNEYLDSITGEVEMNKDRSRTVLDGTETVLNGHYIIQVMPQEKAIYLAAARSAANTPAAVQNPVPMVDSLFAHVAGIRTTVEHKDRWDILTLRMPPGQPYSTLRMTIDSRTGYFHEVDYALNTASLVGQDMIESPGHPGPYQSRGRIQVLFSDYRQGQFDDRIFSEENFFTRIAGRYEPVGRYKNYHIYLASSNL